MPGRYFFIIPPQCLKVTYRTNLTRTNQETNTGVVKTVCTKLVGSLQGTDVEKKKSEEARQSRDDSRRQYTHAASS